MGLLSKLNIEELRFKTGDKVKLVKPIKFKNNVTIPTDVEVEIVCVNPILRSYDIYYNGNTYMDFDDKDFV